MKRNWLVDVTRDDLSRIHHALRLWLEHPMVDEMVDRAHYELSERPQYEQLADEIAAELTRRAERAGNRRHIFAKGMSR